MATNFEPYQSSPDESDRVESPPTISSPSQPRISNSSIADPWAAARAQRLPSPSRYTDDDDETTPALADAGGYQDIESQRFRNDYIGPTALAGTGPPPNNASLGNVFETSLGIPLGYEALIAYLLFTTSRRDVGAPLLGSVPGAYHLLVDEDRELYAADGDLLLIGWLAFGAWRNSETLDRVEVPFFGRLASSFVDDE
ncbi:hypothetical protein LTR75_009808 [Friedmanniomyces endolithicus]|nr:hypothetical protein LTR75_009808 [Friedmanniomyces endolithicus]